MTANTTTRDLAVRTGWVEVEPHAPYFTAGGQRWFPSGWCTIRPERIGPDDLRAMAAAGCDTVRLWPDHNESGVLVPNLAELVQTAGSLGMRCSITLLNLGELSDTFIDRPNLKRMRNAYREICDKPADLLTLPAAKELSKQRIEACLDAVGDSPAVYEWVVCSQIDSIYQVPTGVIDAFTTEMSTHLDALERRWLGGNRLRTLTSFDPLPIGETFYRSDWLDVVGLHTYTPAVYTPVDGLQAAWEVAAVTVAACRRRPRGRPVHGIEYGPIQHQFVPDSPPLPEDLLRRYRRSTSFAHLCAGGAGGPLIVPARPSRAQEVLGADRIGVSDQVRPIPPVIDAGLLDAESAFRRVVADPAWQAVDGTPLIDIAPPGTLAVGCGSSDGPSVFWIAADTRLSQRRELIRRAQAGDPDISPLLGYDAALALVQDVAAPMWNPISRMLAGKLTQNGLHEVARERITAALASLTGLVDDIGLPQRPDRLGGIAWDVPGADRPRTYRCYDAATGEVIASGVVRGHLTLPDVAEVVVAVDR